MFDIFDQVIMPVAEVTPQLNPEHVYDVRYDPSNSKILVYEADTDIYNLILASDFELFMTPWYDKKRLHTIMNNIYAQKILRVHPSESRAIVRSYQYDADKEMLKLLNPEHLQTVFDDTIDGQKVWDPEYAQANGMIII